MIMGEIGTKHNIQKNKITNALDMVQENNNIKMQQEIAHEMYSQF